MSMSLASFFRDMDSVYGMLWAKVIVFSFWAFIGTKVQNRENSTPTIYALNLFVIVLLFLIQLKTIHPIGSPCLKTQRATFMSSGYGGSCFA